MTLAEWEARHGKPVATVKGAKYVLQADATPSLWRLDDFVVSSVTGGSVVLVPRTRPPFWKSEDGVGE